MKTLFHKRHYIVIAECLRAFRDSRPYSEGANVNALARMAALVACDRLTHEIADTFAIDNPHFDRSRFLRASGLETK